MEHQKTARPLFRPKTKTYTGMSSKAKSISWDSPIKWPRDLRPILTKRFSDEHALHSTHTLLPIRGICADLSNTGVHDEDNVVWLHRVAHSQHLLKQGLLLLVPTWKITA